MKLVINLALLVLAIGLIWVLAQSISEPIRFNEVRQKREAVVINKLKKIRSAQENFRAITGGFASNFDTLSMVLRQGNFPIIKTTEDPLNPGNFLRDTSYVAASDSVPKIQPSLGNLDSLRYVPYAKAGTTFTIAADTLTYQSTMVNVVEVGTNRKAYMGQWGSERYRKYDQTYQPNSVIKFGNLTAPNTSGNWESK